MANQSKITGAVMLLDCK